MSKPNSSTKRELLALAIAVVLLVGPMALFAQWLSAALPNTVPTEDIRVDNGILAQLQSAVESNEVVRILLLFSITVLALIVLQRIVRYYLSDTIFAGVLGGDAEASSESTQAKVRRFSIFIVFILGTYLATTSVVAIPWMEGERNGKDDSGVSAASMLAGLEGAVDISMFTDTTLRPKALADLMMISKSLTDTQNVRERIGATTHRAYELMATEYAGDSNRVANEINDYVMNTVRRELADAQRVLTSALALDSLQTSTAERRIYFERLIEWVHGEQAWAMASFNSLERALRDFHDLWASATDSVRMFIEEGGERGDLKLYLDRSFFRRLSTRIRKQVLMQINEVHPQNDPPEYPKPGEGWGLFGVLTRWLLQTRSVDLTLIVGMLGFGLVGAGAATYVRTRNVKDDENVRSTFTDFLVPGVTAAVIIFLAAKGGMSIMTSGETTLSPYMLFLICLVGAVFNEEIWNWAENMLKRTSFISGKGKIDMAKKGTAASPAAKKSADAKSGSQSETSEQGGSSSPSSSSEV